MVAAALRRGLSTGAGDRGIELSKGRVLALYHSGIFPGGALVLSAYLHTGVALTQENWQILSTIGQWLTSQALPFIVGGIFQVGAQAAGGQWMGARRRWLRGGAAARHGHAVASSHRLLRRRVPSNHANFPSHCAAQSCQNRCFHAARPAHEASHEQAEALACFQAEWLQEASPRL